MSRFERYLSALTQPMRGPQALYGRRTRRAEAPSSFALEASDSEGLLQAAKAPATETTKHAVARSFAGVEDERTEATIRREDMKGVFDTQIPFARVQYS